MATPSSPSVRRGRTVRALARLLPVLLVVAGLQAADVVSASHAPQAHAATATGVGGRFVSVQSSLLDTQTGVGGYSAPMPAGAYRTVTVAGRAGLPTSGIAAVQVSVTAVNPAAAGVVTLRPQTRVQSFTALVYHQGSVSGSVTNTAIVAVSDAGTFDVWTQTSIDLQIDVQGYYTSGDPTAGGYVSVPAARTVNTSDGTGLAAAGPLAAGSDTVIGVGGTAGVPVGASAAFVNFTISGSSVSGSLVPYATGDAVPDVSLTYMPSVTTTIGATVPLNAAGQVTVRLSSTASATVTMDVLGYFTAGTSSGAYTPAAVRLADSSVAPATTIPANATITVQVTGVLGVPATGSGITAVAANIHIRHLSGTNPGYARVWAADAPEPTTANDLTYDARSTLSNLFTTSISADGAIKIHNASADAVGYAVDLEGWFTTLGSVIPAGQDRTQERITLQATAPGSANYVTYRYRVGSKGSFSTVPVADVVVPGTITHPSSWPVTRNAAGGFDPYTWDLGVTVAHGDKLVQVQACLGTSATDANPLCSMPTNVQLASHAFGDSYATTSVGPGTLALLTGDYSISATDVSVASYRGSLSLGRTLTTLTPTPASAGAAGVFGPGWTGDLTGPGSGDTDLALAVTGSGYLTLTAPEGAASVYQAVPGSGYPISFTGVGDAAADGGTLVQTDSSHVSMTAPGGAVTTWTGAGSAWSLASVTEAGSGAASTYTYNSAGLATRILAPVPAGVTCTSPDTTPGCRSLTLTYTTVAGASRLSSVSLVAYDPQTAAMTTTPVAAYDYTTGGQLADEYDPRLSPPLKTAYTYDSNGRLASFTPPGLVPAALGYDSTGRLSTVSRYDASNSATATSTVVYGVPITGSGAPVDLSASATSQWGQTTDLVVTGTAVFGPDHQPASTIPSGVTAADWPYADLHYLDIVGRETNTAAYGAGTWQYGATTYDNAGNPVRVLTPGNRAQALAPASNTDPTVAALSSAPARADLLASTATYDPLAPSLVSDAYGPLHPFTSSGATLHGRAHAATTYDENAPDGTLITGLPTTTVTSTQTSEGVDRDPITSRIGYAALVPGDPTGWTLGAATSTTVLGAGPSGTDNLTRSTRYNSAGQVTENRQPGSNGADAHTRVTTYYTATGTGVCVSPALAGLVCSIGPAAQPTSGNALPVTTYTFDRYNNPTDAVETFGSTKRTTTTNYDQAERPARTSLVVTPVGAGGTPVPAVTTTYDRTSGLLRTQATDRATLTSAYDSLGRLATYTDATGATTIYRYDLSGHPINRDDGKASTTWLYDSTDEHRDLVTAENVGGTSTTSAGAFTATWNPDGQPDTVTYPGGTTASTRYDNAGSAITLTYSASSGATLAQFREIRDAQGRAGTQSSPQSAQNFEYDTAGRLITVADTVTAASAATCTTRAYAFDADSNRTNLKSYPDDGAAPSTGHCTTSTTPAITSSNYDSADRLTNSGYSYDTLGRTLSVPARDSFGIGTHASTSGVMTLGYYANDMVNTQSQGVASITFGLDPAQNRIATQISGEGTTSTNHYSDSSDSPTWTSTSSEVWARNIVGPAGGLVASEASNGNLTLRIANLHGDLVASVNSTNTGLSNYSETTEYGVPRAATAADTTYGYLGTARRSTDTLGGLVIMGLRLYNPSSGRFLSVDPVMGGSANAYDYAAQDPVNHSDVSGRCIIYCDSMDIPLYLKRYFKRVKKTSNQIGDEAENKLGAALPHVFPGAFIQKDLRIETAVGLRIYDWAVYRYDTHQWLFYEVKANNAYRRAPQRSKDSWVLRHYLLASIVVVNYQIDPYYYSCVGVRCPGAGPA